MNRELVLYDDRSSIEIILKIDHRKYGQPLSVFLDIRPKLNELFILIFEILNSEEGEYNG